MALDQNASQVRVALSKSHGNTITFKYIWSDSLGWNHGPLCYYYNKKDKDSNGLHRGLPGGVLAYAWWDLLAGWRVYIVYTQLAHGKKCEGRWYHGCYFVKGNCLLAKQGINYNTRECPWRGCLQSFGRHSRCWTVCLEHSIHCLWSNFFLTSSLIKGFQCLWRNCFVPCAKHKYK